MAVGESDENQLFHRAFDGISNNNTTMEVEKMTKMPMREDLYWK